MKDVASYSRFITYVQDIKLNNTAYIGEASSFIFFTSHSE